MLFVEFHDDDVGALDRQVVAGCPCPGLSGTIALVNADGALFAVEEMPTTVRWNGRVKREVDAVGLNHLLQPHVGAIAFGLGERVVRGPGPDSRACLAWATARASWTGRPGLLQPSVQPRRGLVAAGLPRAAGGLPRAAPGLGEAADTIGAPPNNAGHDSLGNWGRMPWVLLIVAGLLEVGWAIGLKYTEGFTRLWPSVFTIVAMVPQCGACSALR